MRQGWVWAALGLAAVATSSCGEPAAAATSPDLLVLELGGQQASLRESLRAMGRPVAPPRRLRPESAQPAAGSARPRPAPVDPPAERPAQVNAPVVADPPAAVPPALSEWVWDELRVDETLGHAAYRLLGSSRRYREIMEWNGIREGEERRLRVGFRFKLKRTELK